MKKLILSTVLFVCAISLWQHSVLAQVSATITLEPKNPEPNSTVTLTIESYSFDVQLANIVWKIGGSVVRQGVGEVALAVKTGEVGQTIPVTVSAEAPNGAKVEQIINITPSSVIILYESPTSYVPVLYEGRSLPSTGALVRVTALPSMSERGVAVPPSSLSYTWSLNDTIIKSASGLGKQSASIRLDYLSNKSEIKVIVRSALGNTGEKTITIYPHDVMPMLYTHDPVLGPNFVTAIMRRFEAVKEFTLALEPFYVSSEEETPTFSWYLDGLPSTPLGGRILALRPKEDSYGTKMLVINVKGEDRPLQRAEIKTELIFDTRK